MILAVAIGAFSSVGRAIARQAMGHRFESCNAHHFHSVPGRNAGDVADDDYCTPELSELQVCLRGKGWGAPRR